VNARCISLSYVLNTDQRLQGIIGGDNFREYSGKEEDTQKNEANNGRPLAKNSAKGQSPETIRPVLSQVGDGGIIQGGQLNN
jgi:hypothetical protein